MPHYSVRFLNQEGRMTGRVQFEALSHEEAKAIADKITDPRSKELWFGSVPILTWPAPSQSEAAPSTRVARRSH